jgi:hypothetical protein
LSDFVFTSVESSPSVLKQTLRILTLGQGTLVLTANGLRSNEALLAVK